MSTLHEYLTTAVQDEAQRAGERHRLLLEARRARRTRLQRPAAAGAAKRFARFWFRKATAQRIS